MCAYEKNSAGIMLVSLRTVLSNITPTVVSQKENRLYDLFAMKVAFSSLYFAFRVYLLIFCLSYSL